MAGGFFAIKHLNYKWFKGLLGLLLFLVMSHARAQTPVLEWCLDDYPQRHHYPKNGEPYGPTVDLMQELAMRAGFILKFSPDTPFARCLKQMAMGKTDLMINLNYSEQRASYMHLLPYTKGLPEVLYVRANQQDALTFSQLKRQPVALVRGYVYADGLLTSIEQQQLIVHHADTLDNAFGLLLRSRVDAVVAPQQQASFVIANHAKYQGQFLKVPLDNELVTALYAHLGFSKQSAYPELLPAIENALKQMMAEGRMKLPTSVNHP